MTKKHFDAIAEAIHAQVELSSKLGQQDVIDALRAVAVGLCAEFVRFNHNFDGRRFLAACGIDR